MKMKLSQQTRALGRNGSFKCTGFSFWKRDKTTTIIPITSKGMEGRCEIEVPNEDLARFCGHLQQDVVSLVLARLTQETLPILLGLNPVIDDCIAKILAKDKSQYETGFLWVRLGDNADYEQYGCLMDFAEFLKTELKITEPFVRHGEYGIENSQFSDLNYISLYYGDEEAQAHRGIHKEELEALNTLIKEN